MPGWVRRQLEDIADLLRSSPERTKAEFRRLGVLFVMHPTTENGRQFYRAIGTTPVSELLSGVHEHALSTTALTDLRSKS
jgi:hypothetical protein